MKTFSKISFECNGMAVLCLIHMCVKRWWTGHNIVVDVDDDDGGVQYGICWRWQEFSFSFRLLLFLLSINNYFIILVVFFHRLQFEILIRRVVYEIFRVLIFYLIYIFTDFFQQQNVDLIPRCLCTNGESRNYHYFYYL